jgi:hypothetical protein
MAAIEVREINKKHKDTVQDSDNTIKENRASRS